MTKEETKKIIYKIFDYIDGTNEINKEQNRTFGHPALYFFHSKEELDKRVEEFLNSKDTFDRYDIYYFCNKMIKFLLGPTDSHTEVYMYGSVWLPIKLKTIDDKLYVVNITDEFKEALYGELISINGIDIETIKRDFEEIVSYSTIEFLNIQTEQEMATPDVLRSLPCFDKKFSKLTYTFLKDGEKIDCIFDLNKEYPNLKDNRPKNYTYKLEGDTLVLVYNACNHAERMKQFIKEIKYISRRENIDKFIVDLRGNGGGNSNIINPLIKFLRGKEIVTLIDEGVFSSGSMACIDLYNIGSYVIGTNIATSLSAFGNIDIIKIEDLKLEIDRSTKYFKFDENYRCQSFNRLNFADYFKSPEHFYSFDPMIIEPDKYVYKTLDDYKNNTDSQMEAAFKHLSKSKSIV